MRAVEIPPGLIGGIIFDLDDTLAPEEAFVLSGFRHVASCLGAKHGYAPEHLFTVMRELFRKKEKKVFNRLLDELNKEYCERDILDLIEIYRTHIPDDGYRLYPDCREVLPLLFARYRCALITDGYLEMQQNKLRKLGLESCLSPVIINSDKACFKPHTGAYEKVVAEWKLSPRHILCLGDNPLKDFVAPLQMGMVTARIRRKGLYSMRRGPKAWRARHTLRDLWELFDILAPGKNDETRRGTQPC
jgi:putative hydrolase of the HAD superfamily